MALTITAFDPRIAFKCIGRMFCLIYFPIMVIENNNNSDYNLVLVAAELFLGDKFYFSFTTFLLNLLGLIKWLSLCKFTSIYSIAEKIFYRYFVKTLFNWSIIRVIICKMKSWILGRCGRFVLNFFLYMYIKPQFCTTGIVNLWKKFKIAVTRLKFLWVSNFFNFFFIELCKSLFVTIASFFIFRKKSKSPRNR